MQHSLVFFVLFLHLYLYASRSSHSNALCIQLYAAMHYIFICSNGHRPVHIRNNEIIAYMLVDTVRSKTNDNIKLANQTKWPYEWVGRTISRYHFVMFLYNLINFFSHNLDSKCHKAAGDVEHADNNGGGHPKRFFVLLEKGLINILSVICRITTDLNIL